jgi:hypothetical protein
MENIMQSNARLSLNAKSASPWYANRWPWLLMLGPVAVVVAGMFTAWLAFSHQDALVVDDYYKQGKAINQDLRRDRVAAQMQADADIRYDPSAGRLEGRIHSLSRAAPGSFFVQLVHSTQPEKDVRLTLRADADGRFSVALPMLDIARWQVLIEPEQRDWRLNGVWNWPNEQQVRLQAK